MYNDNERIFMEILDLCQSLEDDELKQLIANIKCIIDNRKEVED